MGSFGGEGAGIVDGVLVAHAGQRFKGKGRIGSKSGGFVGFYFIKGIAGYCSFVVIPRTKCEGNVGYTAAVEGSGLVVGR